jgi:hypothetical protein
MDFNYSRKAESASGRRIERLLEIFPGAASWVIIVGICVLSAVKPMVAAVVMIAFFLYWLLRLVYMNIFLLFSYSRLSEEKDADWMHRIRALRSELSDSICHLVIFTVISEARAVIEPGIRAVRDGAYPAKKFLVVIALEDSAAESVKSGVFGLQREYSGDFLDLQVIVHPAHLEGEARVKGANATYAARGARQYLEQNNIPLENVIVSCFDADTVANPNYFSCLAYNFIKNPHRLRSSYQPIPVYYNNIWEASAFARILDIGTSFFQLVEATNPGKLVTFSSHSMSFRALVDVGYWPVDMISDDSAIFWKAFLYYDGDYRTVPIYTTVSMDIAMGHTVAGTFANIYKQKRRWAWGVENLPIVLRAFLGSGRISLYKKLGYGYKLIDHFLSWSTWPFLLLFGSWLPGFFASGEFASSTVYFTSPRIRATIFALASLGMLVCMGISSSLMPKESIRYGALKRFGHLFEWLLIPVVVIALSAIPALDAQTRLMSGRYMEFRATDKYRKKG